MASGQNIQQHPPRSSVMMRRFQGRAEKRRCAVLTNDANIYKAVARIEASRVVHATQLHHTDASAITLDRSHKFSCARNPTSSIIAMKVVSGLMTEYCIIPSLQYRRNDAPMGMGSW